MRTLIESGLILISFYSLMACSSGGSGGPAGISFAPAAPTDGSISLTIKSGRGFSCFSYSGTVFCSGASFNSDLAINSVSYRQYAKNADAPISSLLVLDNTLCFTSIFSSHVANGESMYSSYCLGVATLQNTNDPRGIYSWVYFNDPSNLPSDLTVAATPMYGADVDGPTLIAMNLFTDSSDYVSTEVISCSISPDLMTITCPSFSVTLN